MRARGIERVQENSLLAYWRLIVLNVLQLEVPPCFCPQAAVAWYVSICCLFEPMQAPRLPLSAEAPVTKLNSIYCWFCSH